MSTSYGTVTGPRRKSFRFFAEFSPKGEREKPLADRWSCGYAGKQGITRTGQSFKVLNVILWHRYSSHVGISLLFNGKALRKLVLVGVEGDHCCDCPVGVRRRYHG